MIPPSTAISVVICTYNRADRLAPVFDTLAAQRGTESFLWDVLVVDNASTDHTRAVVEGYAAAGALPSLHYSFEAEPGLTAARLRGVRATQAPWIAFVDDDNLLEPDWIAAVHRAIRAHPDAGGIGGQVILDWEGFPPAYLAPFHYCFAEQLIGAEDCQTDNLAGAGMVLKREALMACGWVDKPLLGDRTGKTLVSGGDVEIAQRVRSAGYSLWLTPAAVLRHRIPSDRMTRSYLYRINIQLGISSAVIGMLKWPGDWMSWHRQALSRRSKWFRTTAAGMVWSVRHRSGITQAIAWCSFAIGYARGVRRCEKLSDVDRKRLLGAGAAAQAENITDAP